MDNVLIRYDSRNGIREFITNGKTVYLGSEDLIELSEKSFEEFSGTVRMQCGYGLNMHETENVYDAIQETVNESPWILEEIVR